MTEALGICVIKSECESRIKSEQATHIRRKGGRRLSCRFYDEKVNLNHECKVLLDRERNRKKNEKPKVFSDHTGRHVKNLRNSRRRRKKKHKLSFLHQLREAKKNRTGRAKKTE